MRTYRDLLPPPKHPYLVTTRAEVYREKKIKNLGNRVSREDQDFLYKSRKAFQQKEILFEEFFLLFRNYDYLPPKLFHSAFEKCKSYFWKTEGGQKWVQSIQGIQEEGKRSNIDPQFEQLHKTLEINNDY